jgi:hypothetical protein
MTEREAKEPQQGSYGATDQAQCHRAALHIDSLGVLLSLASWNCLEFGEAV